MWPAMPDHAPEEWTLYLAAGKKLRGHKRNIASIPTASSGTRPFVYFYPGAVRIAEKVSAPVKRPHRS